MKISLQFLMTCFWILSCLNMDAQKKTDKVAQQLIDQCIEAHGGSNYEKLNVTFDFRQYKFSIKQHKKGYLYDRIYTDSLGNNLKDILNNGVYSHEQNGKIIPLSEKLKSRYREGVNSVAYFMLLPYKLRDKAVNSQYIGSIELDGQNYDKIKVWFDKEGGGQDHEDIFCFWIHQSRHTLDYLAYTNGGPRFRKCTKREKTGGVIFQNYDNFQIMDKEIPSDQYDQAYKEGKYKLLSKIEQNNYKTK
ncbi:MAG: DUF6503 family protein [Saprospiraceae bacterium]